MTPSVVYAVIDVLLAAGLGVLLWWLDELDRRQQEVDRVLAADRAELELDDDVLPADWPIRESPAPTRHLERVR